MNSFNEYDHSPDQIGIAADTVALRRLRSLRESTVENLPPHVDLVDSDVYRHAFHMLYDTQDETVGEETQTVPERPSTETLTEVVTPSRPHPFTSTQRAAPAATSEDIFRDFTSSMSDLLKQFTSVSRSPAHARAAPTFEYTGSLEEDPAQLILVLEDYAREAKILDDRELLRLVRTLLTGEARSWANSFKNVHLSYNEFKSLFFQRFDSPDCLARANISFFADKQAEREPAEVFLSRKRQLMARLRPNISVATAIGIFVTLLRPEIGTILRGARLLSFNELVLLASSVEQGIRREPIRSTPERRPLNGPASPCRFCQAWHFHNECPRNPFRQPGNGRPVDGNTRRPAPPTHAQPPNRSSEIRRDAPRLNNAAPASQREN